MAEKMYRQYRGERIELTPEQVEATLTRRAAYNEEKKEREFNEKKVAKRKAFQEEADPLFFKWQRGEATEQEWLDKVTEIKSRYN